MGVCPHGGDRPRPRPLQARLGGRRGVRVPAREGPRRRRRQRHVLVEGRAGLDGEEAPEGVADLRQQADGPLVRGQHARPQLRRHLLLHQAHAGSGRRVGRAARADEGDLREARHPRSRAEVPRRRNGSIRERSRLPPQPRRARGPGDPVLRHGHRRARVPRCRQALLRHSDPAGRQQVRGAELGSVVGRLVHLRASGRRVRDAAAGLLPHQQRERWAVRTHADHRRRGLEGALHRGLLGAGVHERLVALSCRRDHRRPQCPRDLHDDPELVAERLQPRHQARPRRDRGPHGVDRRQHRQPPDDEVPVGVHGRPQGFG